jgi:hypothetical protein
LASFAPDRWRPGVAAVTVPQPKPSGFNVNKIAIAVELKDL